MGDGDSEIFMRIASALRVLAEDVDALAASSRTTEMCPPSTSTSERLAHAGFPLGKDGQPKKVLSVDEAAAILEMSRSTIYAWVRAGRLPSIRIGGVSKIPAARLLDIVDGQANSEPADS